MLRNTCVFATLLTCCTAVLAQNRPAARPASRPATRPALPEQVVATIRIAPGEVLHPVSPVFVGSNLNPGGPRDKLITDPAVLARIRGLGLKTMRFPNGCVADLYNWQKPGAGQISVDGFLAFCEAIDAEPYYTLNMQGGTEGLTGPVPAAAALEERIRYQHTAPNPCGYTNYYFGTLAEALALLDKYTIERAKAGQRPILHYELGNENWGQSGTDWQPEVYGKTCEVYAKAFRDHLAEAARSEPRLQDLKLYIVAVAFPSMGNNQDAFKALNADINVAWTREMNRLGDLGLIDAVQEHFYPYGNADGSTLIWTVHNLSNIAHLRYGKPNPRLGGYTDPALAYTVPVEWTEWNLKCWGDRPRSDFKLANSGFEGLLKGWTTEAEPKSAGKAVVQPKAARRGQRGLQLTTTAEGNWSQASMRFSVADRPKAAGFGAAVWVRADYPADAHVILRQANDGPHKGQVLIDRRGSVAGMWHRVVAVGKPFEDTTETELLLRAQGANMLAWFDEVELLHWPTFSGMMPLAADCFEQQLFLVDAQRALLEWPTPRMHVHHTIGTYPCGLLNQDGSLRDNALAFALLHERIGEAVVRTTCEVPCFDYDTQDDAYATNFNALAADAKGVPALSVLATKRADQLFVLLINRTSDRDITARINLEGVTPLAAGELRTLSGVDFDVAGAKLATEAMKAAANLVHSVPAHSAQVLSFQVKSGS